MGTLKKGLQTKQENTTGGHIDNNGTKWFCENEYQFQYYGMFQNIFLKFSPMGCNVGLLLIPLQHVKVILRRPS